MNLWLLIPAIWGGGAVIGFAVVCFTDGLLNRTDFRDYGGGILGWPLLLFVYAVCLPFWALNMLGIRLRKDAPQ